jgi:hypothetical protein
MTKEVFRSRFGFHPVPYKLYLKLKFIHKCYFQTLRDRARWQRWNNKLPKNRVIRKWQRDTNGNKISFEVVGMQPEPKVFWDLVYPNGRVSHKFEANKLWVADYQKARMPVVTEKEVPNLTYTIDEINQMYYKCREFFGE